jgi:asparagine synthetase B (glutamine-hydrolysing)
VEQLRVHLKSAVESHMVADVPVGAFLSGGLDSGALVALMAGASKEPIRRLQLDLLRRLAGMMNEKLHERLPTATTQITMNACWRRKSPAFCQKL